MALVAFFELLLGTSHLADAIAAKDTELVALGGRVGQLEDEAERWVLCAGGGQRKESDRRGWEGDCRQPRCSGCVHARPAACVGRAPQEQRREF